MMRPAPTIFEKLKTITNPEELDGFKAQLVADGRWETIDGIKAAVAQRQNELMNRR